MDDFCKNLLNFSELLMTKATDSDNNDLADQYLRTAISKGYYSAFHRSKMISDKLPQATAKGTHNIVIQTLTGATLASSNNIEDCKTKIRRIGIYLGQIKSNRVDADYFHDAHFSDKDIELHFNTINKIVVLHKEVVSLMSLKAV